MPHGLGPASILPSNSPEEGTAGRFDAHLGGLSEEFASQTDACLLVEGQKLHVHRALLALNSSVLCDMFSIALAENVASHCKEETLCVAMHPEEYNIADTSTALKFLYQRSFLGCLPNTPSKHLWQSLDKARPVVDFAHKLNMHSVLEECDTCLSDKAEEKGGSLMFGSADATIAWANFAQDFGLKKLLSKVEYYLLKRTDSDFWQDESFAKKQLGQACLLRVIRAAQHDRAASKAAFGAGFRDMCIGAPNHAILAKIVAREYVSSDTLLSWQECGNDKSEV